MLQIHGLKYPKERISIPKKDAGNYSSKIIKTKEDFDQDSLRPGGQTRADLQNQR